MLAGPHGGLSESFIHMAKTQTTQELTKYLDPKVLAKITRLDLQARLVVEGFISGLHRSPFHGFSVEFATHREYVPGDDVKHIDYKVLAKTDRYYIKQYEPADQRTFRLAQIVLARFGQS